jgi:hypothetical protein
MRLASLVGLGIIAIAAHSAAAGPLSSGTLVGLGGNEVIPVHSTCHSSVRNHSGSYPDHYHDQDNCMMLVIQDDDDDCHGNVLRHYLPGYGKIWHQHGYNCEVEIYDYEGGPTTGHGGCIQVGPVTVCN